MGKKSSCASVRYERPVFLFGTLEEMFDFLVLSAQARVVILGLSGKKVAMLSIFSGSSPITLYE